jgi:hypothetical protein
LKFPKGSRRGCEDKAFFKENAQSRGHNSLTTMNKVPMMKCTPAQCDLSLYQVSSKSPKVLGVAKTKYFSKKAVSLRAVTFKNH